MKKRNNPDIELTSKDDVVAVQLESGKWRLYEYEQWFGASGGKTLGGGHQDRIFNVFRDRTGNILNFNSLDEAREYAGRIK